MKKNWILLITCLLALNVFAQFGDPPMGNGDPCSGSNPPPNCGDGDPDNNDGNNVPIDKEIVYLLIAGGLFGAWKLKKNQVKVTEI